MAALNKGKIFHKCLVHTLLTLVKKIPVAGGLIELPLDWIDSVSEEQDKLALEERIAQLEQAAALTPQVAREIAATVVQEQRAQGMLVDAEREQAVLDIAAFIPATVRERTRATLSLAHKRGVPGSTVLPVAADEAGRDAFYQSLMPARRPRFHGGGEIPGLPGWTLGEFLGAGGFGEVWQARKHALRCAVKFCADLDATGIKLLKREAEALFALQEHLAARPERHQMIYLRDLNLDAEPYWLAFEYVPGGTLESLMRGGNLSMEESLALFLPIVRGMAAVHRAGVIHRDLKPANILLDADGIPKIADFGIGKLVETETTGLTRQTARGFGSVHYMSQEQKTGAPAHPADDVYALGVVLWQMFTHTLGKPCYLSESMDAARVPAALQNLVLECVAKSRAKRPQDAGALLALLQAPHAAPSTSSIQSIPSRPPAPHPGQTFRDFVS